MRMKRVVFFCFFVVVALASCNKKQPEDRISEENRITLTITNNTRGTIKEIIFSPSKGSPYTQTCTIEKGDSSIVYVARSEYYDVDLVDTKGHRYSKTNCRWTGSHGTLIITDKDFHSQGPWDTFKKTLGL